MMKVNQLGSDKKFTRQLSELSGTIAETESELNKWVVASYNEKNLDFQVISDRDFIAVLLDVNLYESSDLVANAFRLLVRYFT